MYYISNQNELYHHGILGQKWGIRRYQLSDGTWTEEGLKRRRANLNENISRYKQLKKNLNRDISDYKRKAYAYGEYDKKVVDKIQNEYQIKKKELTDDIIWNNIKDKRITSSQQRLINEYKDKYNLTDKEARVQAYKHDIAKGVFTIAAITAASVATVYAVNAYKTYNIDKIIEKGTILSRVTSSDTYAVRDGFYAAIKDNKIDSAKYKGLYAAQKALSGDESYVKLIEVTDKIRIASKKNAKAAMEELFKDKTVRESIEKKMTLLLSNPYITPKQRIAALRAYKALSDNSNNTSAAYDAFNIILANDFGVDSKIRDTYFNILKDRGYQAIIDMNDKSLGGYMTKLPIIVLDSKNTRVTNVKKLGALEIAKNYGIGYGDILLKNGGKVLSVVAGYHGARSIKKSNDNLNIIRDYRNSHPNSNLSDNEILQRELGGNKS